MVVELQRRCAQLSQLDFEEQARIEPWHLQWLICRTEGNGCEASHTCAERAYRHTAGHAMCVARNMLQLPRPHANPFLGEERKLGIHSSVFHS